MVLESLGKSGTSVAAIMREKDALTDPQQQIKESDRLRTRSASPRTSGCPAARRSI